MNLTIVPTPIGNLSDITVRAKEVLENANIIICEDTRQTRKLFSAYAFGNKPEFVSFHARSQKRNLESVLKKIQLVEHAVYVSDAGTPCISDPGTVLVSECRKNDIPVFALPGPCAFVTALSASGLPSNAFTFYGFLPHKKGRETFFKDLIDEEKTAIFYESTHRIEKCLDQIHQFLPERIVCVARELTKVYEEYLHGTAEEILEIMTNTPEKKKGEFVVLIAGKKFT